MFSSALKPTQTRTMATAMPWDANTLAHFTLQMRDLGTKVLDLHIPTPPPSERAYSFAGANGNSDDEKEDDTEFLEMTDVVDEDEDEDEDDEDISDTDWFSETAEGPRPRKRARWVRDQDVTTVVEALQNQFQQLPAELRLLVLQYALRPRFLPAYEWNRATQSYRRVDIDMRKAHAMHEIRRLAATYVAVMRLSSTWRDFLRDPYLRVALYRSWFMEPTAPFYLDASKPDTMVFPGGQWTRDQVQQFEPSVPELDPSVPYDPSWFPVYLANRFLHEFLSQQSRDAWKLERAYRQTTFHRLSKRVFSVIPWDGRRMSYASVVKQYAWPLAANISKGYSFEERFYRKVNEDDDADQDADDRDEFPDYTYTVTLPGFSRMSGIIVGDQMTRNEWADRKFHARWIWGDPLVEPQHFEFSDVDLTGHPTANIPDPFILFAHRSLTAASVLRIPTILLPAVNHLSFFDGTDRNDDWNMADLEIRLVRRRTLLFDPPVRVPADTDLEIAVSLGSPIEPTLGFGVGFLPPPQLVRLQNVRLGSTQQTRWVLSQLLYIGAARPMWIELEQTTRARRDPAGDLYFDIDNKLFRDARDPRFLLRYHAIVITLREPPRHVNTDLEQPLGSDVRLKRIGSPPPRNHYLAQLVRPIDTSLPDSRPDLTEDTVEEFYGVNMFTGSYSLFADSTYVYI